MVSTEETSLAEEKRRLTLERILRATGRLLSERGLDVTVDAIAEAAGVSRRTVFRHFETREALLAAAARAWVAEYGERLPRYDGGDGRRWLTDLLTTIHRLNAGYGPGYWEFVVRRDVGPELAAVQRGGLDRRRRGMRVLAETAWAALGRTGPVPDDVITVFATHCGPHFTAAVTDDGGGDGALAARLAEAAILRVMGLDGTASE